MEAAPCYYLRLSVKEVNLLLLSIFLHLFVKERSQSLGIIKCSSSSSSSSSLEEINDAGVQFLPIRFERIGDGVTKQLVLFIFSFRLHFSLVKFKLFETENPAMQYFLINFDVGTASTSRGLLDIDFSNFFSLLLNTIVVLVVVKQFRSIRFDEGDSSLSNSRLLKINPL